MRRNGPRQPGTRATPEAKRKIRTLYAAGEITMVDLAKRFGLPVHWVRTQIRMAASTS